MWTSYLKLSGYQSQSQAWNSPSVRKRVKRKDADSSVVKKKHERNPMTQEQKRRLETPRQGKTKQRKKHWPPTGCAQGLKKKTCKFATYIDVIYK